MKVCFVVGSLGGGGAERVVLNLSGEFIHRGIGTSVITVSDSKIDYSIPKGLEIHHIKIKSNLFGVRYLSRMVLLRRFIRKNKYDIVISFAGANTMCAFSMIMFKKAKLVLCERNDPNSLPQKKVSRIIRDISYHFCDQLVFQTKMAEQYFRSIRKRKIIIYNPLRTDLPSDGEHVHERFINIGRLCEQKNQLLLIRAFSEVHKRYPFVSLKIYGKGPLEAKLKQYTCECGLDDVITFCGFSTNVLEEIKDDKYFVLSSNFEGMSNALIEAMALGMTVISTDHPIGGAGELIINKENGLLVPVEDEKALSSAMLYCLENKNKAVSMGFAAKQIREKLCLSEVANTWIKMLKELVNEK